MSAAEFWHGESWLASAYRNAYDIARQRKSEEMWLQGLYNFNAFSTALSNLHFDGKRHRMNQYMKEPLRLIPYTDEEKAVIAERERQKAIEYFDRLVKKWPSGTK